MTATLLATLSLATPVLTPIWKVSFQDEFTDIAIVEQTLFFGTNRSYGAVDLETGKKLWAKSLAKDQLGAKVGSDGKTFVVSIGKGPVLAFEARTGKPKWTAQHKGFASPVALIDGMAYVELIHGTLTKLDAETKKPVWTTKIDEEPNKEGLSVMSIAPKMFAGKLMVGTRTGLVKAIDPETGKEIWQSGIGDTSVQGWASDDERLYITSDNGTIAASSLETGGSRWRVLTGNGIFGNPLVKDGRVYVTSLAGYILNLGALNGTQLWRRFLSDRQDFGLSQSIVFDNGLLLVQRKKLLRLDLEGRKQWEIETETDLFGQTPIQLGTDLLLRGSHEIMRVRPEGD